MRLFVVSVLLIAMQSVAGADAIMVTRAMRATTILEMRIEEGAITVDLEIGIRDLDGFRNLMPDEIYEKVARASRPLDERLVEFFSRDFVLRLDGGDPLFGRVEMIEGRRRVVRDVITGEPTGESEEVVIVARLAYPLSGRPKTLTITPPRNEQGASGASIGFIVYHQGLPVLDFRYLAAKETADLDWEDPWFSKFRNRNLKRQYPEPIRAFLYVDGFEVRKEIVFRPRDLEPWVDLGLEGEEIIPVAAQAELKRKIVAFLAKKNPVTIDGVPAEGMIDRIHFIRRSLRMTSVIDPPEDLAAVSALMGVIFVYPTTGLPEVVTMKWELWNERISRLPVTATDEAGGLPSYLTPDDPVLVWQNFLKHPRSTELVVIRPPTVRGIVAIPILTVVFVLAALWGARRRTKRSLVVGGMLLISAALCWPVARVSVRNPFSSEPQIAEEDAGELMGGLLRNVYRAFDHRGESDIYDTLARSATGDLLREIYLETRRALTLANQGGARARVQEVEIVETETEVLEEGFRSRCVWNVIGSVGHWGHIHRRVNQYEATMTVRPIDGVWKITGLDVTSEKRL